MSDNILKEYNDLKKMTKHFKMNDMHLYNLSYQQSNEINEEDTNIHYTFNNINTLQQATEDEEDDTLDNSDDSLDDFQKAILELEKEKLAKKKKKKKNKEQQKN